MNDSHDFGNEGVSKFAEWIADGPWPIDGGLSGELESLGHDLSDNLWSARLLRDDPQSIQQVHASYVTAGARVLITSSYQASRQGFSAAGLSGQQADELISTSVQIARNVASSAVTKVWVAASVGPYGAVLGGGQEYVGNYGISHSALVDFHRERIEVLAAAQPDVFACETIPDLREVEALLEVLADYRRIPAWITMSCKNATDTCAGQPVAGLSDLVSSSSNVAGIGVNCTMPEFVSSLLEQLGSAKPLVVYPNAGRVWDGAARQWVGQGMTSIPSQAVTEWVTLGAQLIGGCCGLGPHAISDLDSQFEELRKSATQ